MRWHRSLILPLILGAGLARADVPATAPAATQGARTVRPLKAEILKSVDTARRGMETLSVEFRFDATGNAGSDDRARYQAHIVVRGHDTAGIARQILIDRSYGASDDKLYHQRIAFNGKFTCWYQEFNHLAGLMPGVLPNVDVRREGFFALNMLSDPSRGPEASKINGSLAGMLRSVYTSVRPRMEDVDGVRCYVVDNGGWFHTDMTVWLDPDRGFLPIKQRIFGEKRDDVTEWDVDRAERVGDKWIATEGREVLPNGAVVRLAVLRDEKGAPKIAVNEKLADDYFDLWKTLPLGTRVFNEAANRTYVVGEHGELNVLSEGRNVGGEEVSPELHGGPSAGARIFQKLLFVAAAPTVFLAGSLIAMVVWGWIGMRRGRRLATDAGG